MHTTLGIDPSPGVTVQGNAATTICNPVDIVGMFAYNACSVPEGIEIVVVVGDAADTVVAEFSTLLSKKSYCRPALLLHASLFATLNITSLSSTFCGIVDDCIAVSSGLRASSWLRLL